MVNETKLHILHQLKDSKDWHSGAQFSQELGISRVAVWKQIKSLIQQGYPIESGSKGYRITQNNDALTSLEFKQDKRIIFYDELTSTMDEALNQMRHQPSTMKNFLVLADHQSRGVGRDHEQWDSPSGGIYLTFVYREIFDVGELPLMKKRGILTLLNTLNILAIHDLSFSDSGDIYFAEKKGAGILEEYQVRGKTVQWYALGIGLHLNDIPASKTMTSASLHTGKEFKRSELVWKLQEQWKKCLTLKAIEIEKQLRPYTKCRDQSQEKSKIPGVDHDKRDH
jgi:BirA family biotin operon repressor/biotin-[acetyl-CoA-carboxylase] ligase